MKYRIKAVKYSDNIEYYPQYKNWLGFWNYFYSYYYSGWREIICFLTMKECEKFLAKEIKDTSPVIVYYDYP